MPTAADHPAILESLRPTVLARLVEIRGSLDYTLGRGSDADAREQFDAVLRHLQNYLTTWDWRTHRSFLQTYLAMRSGDGMSSDDVLHLLAAIVDAIVEIVRRDREHHPATPELLVALSKFSAHTVRCVIDLVAEDLERRRAQRDQLRAGLGGAR